MKQEFVMPTGDIIKTEFPMWKTPYNHDTNFESDRTATYCNDPSLTKQEFKEEADINTIIKRFAQIGEQPPMALPEHFTDTTTRLDYLEMNTRLANANAMFYRLPADKRAEHHNDPTRWADAVVAACRKNDGDALDALGIDTSAERAEAAKAAEEAARAASEAAQKAANKSDPGK